MTEEEAKKKWCPFARQMATLDKAKVPFAIASVNRMHGGSFITCFASACMAWRWAHEKHTCGATCEADCRFADDGHCGLAGKP